jgi:Fur family ferric uptake transcriptional regulator
MAATDSPGWEDHAHEQLRRRGGRTGAAREAVIAHLAAQPCCLSAHELFDQLRAEGRAIGIASVYRVLDQLAAAKLVLRIELGDGIARFEAAPPGGEHHHHLVCGECGKVDTFDDPDLEHAVHRVAGARSYTLDEHDIVLHGACAACRN